MAKYMNRRSFLTGIATVALGGASAAFLAACGANSQTSASSGAAGAGDPAADSASASSEASAAATLTGGKTLVAYFSGTGHTKKAAEAAADALGADTFVIEPADPYTDDDLNFNKESSRVVQEYENEDQRDTPLKKSTPDNWADYGTVLIGYPIWWGDAAWAMHHFASDNDFTGKTVIPFCTSYSSPIGSSGETLEKLASTGDWQDGHRFDQEVEAGEVRKWAKGLNI